MCLSVYLLNKKGHNSNDNNIMSNTIYAICNAVEGIIYGTRPNVHAAFNTLFKV